jgi:hypothetical protein
MPERLIDVPIETLPFVDEHSIEVDARVDRVWDALLAVMGNFGGRPARPIARGLGCLPIERSPRFGEIGTTVPGFIVTRAVPPAVLALMGEHRYSRYALIFRIAAEQPNGRLPRLSAETRAEFPGRAGAMYRGLVIGTHGHVLATSSILRSVRRLSERTGSEEGSSP